jgi:hypothetical protein
VCAILIGSRLRPDAHTNCMKSELTEESLKLRYLDWCSSRVAKRFLELSHDEVWLRSDFAASLPAFPADGATALQAEAPDALDRIPGYLDLVRKTALLLAREMDLPSFSEWKEEYLANPETYDTEMLGR